MALTEVKGQRRAMRTLLALGLAPVYAVGAWMIPASAAPGEESHAQARFLGGEVLGLNLDSIAELAGVSVENLGGADPVTEANPVGLAVLDTLNIELPGGLQLPLSDVIQLGAVNQWATAEDGGTSHAATGAVANNGGLGTGVDAGFGGGATFDLASLLGDSLTGLVADLELRLGALSSEAHLVGPAAADGAFEIDRDYEVASGELVLTVPAVEALIPGVEDAVGTVDEVVNGLVGPDGSVTGAIGSAESLISILSVLGADAQVTATLEADLQGAVEAILDEPLGAGTGVEIDLRAGTITLDLDVLSGGLNDRAPNTELLSDAVLDSLAGTIGNLLDGLAGDIVDAVEEALKAATLNVSIYAEIKGAISSLDSVLDISLSDTLGNVLNGTAVFENNSSGLLITPVSGLITGLMSTLVGIIGGVLDEALFADGAALTVLGETVAGLVGGLTDQLVPVGDLLKDLLSIKLNVQPDQPDAMPSGAGGAAGTVSAAFSVAAIEVTVLEAEPVAVVTLARSEVGPNTVAGDGIGASVGQPRS